MTSQEKIDILTAYYNGEDIEFRSHPAFEWEKQNSECFDFLNFEYRILPCTKTVPKFKAGDIVVKKEYAGRYILTDVDINEIYDVDSKSKCYKVTCPAGSKSQISFNKDKDYININDVLWYFETRHYAEKSWKFRDQRMTMDEVKSLYSECNVRPIYALGFYLIGK